MDTLKKFDAWHKTKLGMLVYGILELVFAYIFVCLAIDRGNLIYYLLTLVFLVGALQNFIKLIGLLARGNKRKTN